MKSTKRVEPRQNIENLGQESGRKSVVPTQCALSGMIPYFSRRSLNTVIANHNQVNTGHHNCQ